MGMEHSVEWELLEETKALGETLPICHFVQKIPHDMTGDITRRRSG
jgi:hypothetical protein